MKRTATIYYSLMLNMKGEVHGVHVQNWKVETLIHHEAGFITIGGFEPIEVEVEVPSDAEVRQLAFNALAAQRDKLRAEHQALMTKYQFMMNDLLGLPSPEVAEAEERRPYRDLPAAAPEGDDDIPF